MSGEKELDQPALVTNRTVNKKEIPMENEREAKGQGNPGQGNPGQGNPGQGKPDEGKPGQGNPGQGGQGKP